MQDVQQALRNVDTARNAFVNSDSTDSDVLRDRYESWRDAHNALSESINNADSTKDETVATDETVPAADTPPVSDTPPATDTSPVSDTPPATVPGTDIPSGLGNDTEGLS